MECSATAEHGALGLVALIAEKHGYSALLAMGLLVGVCVAVFICLLVCGAALDRRDSRRGK